MGNLMLCHEAVKDCFARAGSKCELLNSYVREDGTRRFGTKGFRNGCPFYKTAEDAGGTYAELCEKYPLIIEKVVR